MIDKKIQEIEQLAKKLEKEENFDQIVKDFSNAAVLIQKVLTGIKDTTGKITEIVDGVEKAFSEAE